MIREGGGESDSNGLSDDLYDDEPILLFSLYPLLLYLL